MPALTMKRCSLGLLAVVMTLTACGGNDSDAPAKGSDKVSVAAQPSPSPLTPASEGGRPVIDLPSGVTHAFDWGTTGDPLKDAVLADTAQGIKAVDLAIAEQDLVHEDGTAALVYCEDQSKAFNKFLGTGKPDVTPVTKNSYVIYAAILRKNGNGVWVTERLSSQRGSAKCRP